MIERDTSAGVAARSSSANYGALGKLPSLSQHPIGCAGGFDPNYGSVNGFGWKLNETIGAQILSVPMTLPLKLAHEFYMAFLGILVLIFVIVFVVLNLLLHFLVISPVRRVSALAEAVSLGEENVEVFVKPGKDEISSLSAAFNRMRESLNQAMQMLK